MINPQNSSEKTLTVLVDYCTRTKTRVNGDGYEEIVLYHNKRDDTYVIHTYKKDTKMLDEAEIAYVCNEDNYKLVMNKINESKLAQYEGKLGQSVNNIMHSCMFKVDNGYVEINSSNFEKNNIKVLFDIGNLMYSFIQ